MRPVPQYDPKSWLLKALRETANAMEALLWEVDDDCLERKSGGDAWSCAELITHMTEMERRFLDRLERMVRLDEPRIGAFDADSIDAPERQSAYDAMDDLGELRRRSVRLLWSLDAGDWRRKGVHPYIGPMTIMQVAREMNEHDLSHLWQLRRICDAYELATV